MTEAMIIGHVREINRYPVKSMAGERLESCEIVASGLYGDRYCAFYDRTKEGWDRFVTARDIPELLSFQAKLVGEDIAVLSPDGRTFGWDRELLDEMQRRAGKPIALSGYRQPHPEIPGRLSVDEGCLLILSDASLRRLEAVWGKPLDPRRFRANLIVSTSEDAAPEEEWIGKQVAVGDAELIVDSFCDRCSVIGMDPDTLERDPSLLKIVHRTLNSSFGVYASVRKPGRIRVGQPVRLLP